MNRTQKTPTGAATSAGAKVEAGTEQTTTSVDKSITSTSPGQGLHIADLLSRGADHGLHLSDLARLTDLSERAVRQQIEAERRAGALIVSDNRRGYWIANDSEEVQRFVRSMKHRAAQIRQTATAVEIACARAEGQRMLEGWTDG